MSKLPFELLDMIFTELCGREVHAVRLVCTGWERASRPFFAERHLQRSLFWLTGADCRHLESLVRRFGPYIGTVYIAPDHFTFSGLRQVWRNYTSHRDYLDSLVEAIDERGADALLNPTDPGEGDAEEVTPLLGSVTQPLRNRSKHGSEYFRHAYQQRRPLSPWNFLRLWAFLWQFLCNVLTQTWMRVTGLDGRRLTRIAQMMPRGRLEAVRISYAAEELIANEVMYGRAAPGFASELALLCGKGDGGLRDAEYRGHVEKVVAAAMSRRGRCD